uniref:Interferon-inducible double stranded RNA-dependent protein kinase activator A A n=1 Tax=Lygus hesperus TaxID=30085 RepID=A0A146MGP0_LYGHE
MMDSKTPVTILQELLMKKHMVPNYNLILNGVGTHEPIFKYEVSADGYKAVGSGKSKKEAKHDAAHQMLQVMKGVDSAVGALPEEVTSPYEGILKENAVGELQDFCMINQLKLPEYKLIRDEGLPHAKVFSWSCTVSSFTTEATARTKKNAKHMAAQDMLLKLKECLDDIIDPKSCESSPYNSPTYQRLDEMERAIDEAVEKMPRTIRKCNARGKLGLNLSDVCYALTDENMPDLVYLDSIKDYGSSWLDKQEKEDFRDIFMKIAEEMQCEYDLRRLESSDENKRVVSLIVESVPPWTFVGVGQSLLEASDSAFEDAVKFLVKMRI